MINIEEKWKERSCEVDVECLCLRSFHLYFFCRLRAVPSVTG